MNIYCATIIHRAIRNIHNSHYRDTDVRFQSSNPPKKQLVELCPRITGNAFFSATSEFKYLVLSVALALVY